MTLRCVPAFRLRGVDTTLPLEEVLAALDERADAHDHFEFWTFPHSPLALTRTNDRTDAPVERAGAAPRVAARRAARQPRARAAQPRRPPLPARDPARSTGSPRRAASGRERVDASHRVFASPRLVRFDEMEYAIPREHAADAVRGAREILERHPVNFPVELRFVAADDALLSPAHGRDTAYVAVHVFKGMDGERAVPRGRAADGRLGRAPALGQALLPRPRASCKTRYPAWDAFAAARAELDPDGPLREPLGAPHARPALRRARRRRSRLQERLALAAVGRHGLDDSRRRAIRWTASKRSHSSPALAWRNHTRSPIRSAPRGLARHRRLDLAGALLAVQPQPGREHRPRQAVARPPAPEAR